VTHPAAVIQLLAGRLVATLLLSLGGLVAAAAAVPEETSILYLRHCADCHDVIGRGDGPAAGVLSPRPRGFTTGRYKFRSTPSGSLPSVEDVSRVIREGLPGTSMPGSENLLSPESVRRLALFVLRVAPPDAVRRPPMFIGPAPEDSQDAGERGAGLYRSVGCVACHDEDGEAGGERPARESLPQPPGRRS